MSSKQRENDLGPPYAMSSSNRVVAVIPAAAGWEFSGNDQEKELEFRSGGKETPNNRVREVRVTGTAEVSCPADRASVRVNVSNSKESVNEVANSVSRRLEYILQALRWAARAFVSSITLLKQLSTDAGGVRMRNKSMSLW